MKLAVRLRRTWTVPVLVGAFLPLTIVAARQDAPVPDYRDDRSTPEAVIESFYDAVNRKEYARAYAYWEPAAAEFQLPAFDDFQRGYAQTASVLVTMGKVYAGVAAGNLYYSIPVVLTATMTDASTQTFVGCYTLHLPQPALQMKPPYQPMSIQAASILPSDSMDEIDALLDSTCSQR